MDYTNYTILTSDEIANVIVLKLNFDDKDILVIEPETWPTNLDAFCLDLVRRTKDPSYEHHTPGTPTDEGDL